MIPFGVGIPLAVGAIASMMTKVSSAKNVALQEGGIVTREINNATIGEAGAEAVVPLHKLGGIVAPAFNERKMKNMKNDCLLVASKNNIQFNWNAKFPINSLTLMRGYLAISKNLKNKFFEISFDFYWKDNLDISVKENVNQILKLTGIDAEEFYKKIKNEKIKVELKKLTNDAFEKDIFGAPTFVVNNKIFWGQDRLDYAIDEYNS